MNLARSSLKLFIANVGSSGITFIGITYFARELGPAPMGVFFLFQALLGMLAIPADFGLRGAVEKRISEGESKGVFLLTAIVLKTLPITIIVLGILLLRPFINSYIGANVAVLLAIAIVLQEVAQLSISVLKGELRVGETAVLRFVRKVTWIGIGTVLISRGFGAVGLIYALLAGLGAMLVCGWYKASISLNWPSKEHARSLFDYGKYNVVSSIGGYFYSWMDVAIIGLFLTQAHVGAYEIAWRVTAITILLSRAISTTIFPQISSWDAEGAKDRIETLVPKLITPSLILIIPAFFGTLVFSREILRFVFGPEYTMAWLVLIILMFDKITEGVQTVLGKALQAINRPDLAARATVIGVGINFALNIPLIWQFGIVGAAIATTVASLIGGMFLHAFYLSRIIELNIPYREVGVPVVAAVGMAIVLSVLSKLVIVENIIELLSLIGGGIMVYGIVVMLSPQLRYRFIRQSRRVFRAKQEE